MKINLSDVLFLDIETVAKYENYSELPEQEKALWEKKFSKTLKEGQTIEDSYSNAALYAEFGKIVCISIGAAYPKGNDTHFKLSSFYGHDEKKLLLEFKAVIDKFMVKSSRTMCGHNAKSFDFPWIARRMVINGIKLPDCLDIAGKKPWEVNLLDTMDMWKFGDMKHYMSLNTLAYLFGIPSPKDDIDGSQVGNVYYKEKDIDRIAIYCEKDVITTAKVFCSINQMEMFVDPEPLHEAKGKLTQAINDKIKEVKKPAKK